MITYKEGNIFESDAEALVNTVNTVGVMGKGIALQFKKNYSSNYKAYADACRNGEIKVGKMFVFRDSNLSTGERLIINFPTKTDWRKPSEYVYVEEGVKDLVRVIHQYNIKSLALPPLGAGNGGLKWEKVKGIINKYLSDLPVDIFVYEPNVEIREELKKERVKLTPARALLLYVLFDLVRNGEMVSEFSAEKVCYFLQKFGAKKHFKLHYKPQYYGPYSGQVRRLLNVLSGSYIMGYSDMDKKPFDPLLLITDGYEEVEKFIHSDPELLEIAEKTKAFLNGYYSEFSLELLSSVDYIMSEKNTVEKKVIASELDKWSERKKANFKNDQFINLSVQHLQQTSV